MAATLVIVPTYNEAENILAFLNELLSAYPEVDCLVVDDNSPDGTAAHVESHALYGQRLHLLKRPKKNGLGKAYVAGFQWALARSYSFIVQMDADFSHRFKDLGHLIQASSQADFLVGARWIPGGGTVNWGLLRQCISRAGSAYVRLILSTRLHDWTGGFNLWSAEVLRQIPLEKLQASGYAFQIELKFWALRLNFAAKEVPIIFEERRRGQSKMSMSIILEALVEVWRMRFRKI